MSNKCFCHLNGLEVKDATARKKIEELKTTVCTPQMFGAKGDGITDDTEAINKAIQEHNNIYIPEGVYIINGTNEGWGHIYEGGIRPKSNTTITLSPKAVLKCSPNSTGFYNIISLTDVENVVIRGGNIIGERESHEDTYGEFGFGIGIYECNRIIIDNVDISQCWGDGIIIDSKNETSGENNNISINNCIIHDCRRQGISYIIGGNNNTITNCHIYNISGTAPQSGIDIEPNTEDPAKQLIIDECTIHDTVGASIILNRAENCIISNCNLDSINHFIYSKNNYIDNCNIFDFVALFGKGLFVNNSNIGCVACNSGSGKFTNCNFKNKDTGKYAIIYTTNDGSEESIAEFLTFDNCIFTGNEEQYGYIWCFNKKYCVDNMQFTNCKFYNVDRYFYLTCKHTSFINCDFHTTVQLWSLMSASTEDTYHFNVIIDGCTLIHEEEEPKTNYIISIDGNGIPSIIYRDNKFTHYDNFIYTANSTVAGMIIANNNYGDNVGCYNSSKTYVSVVGNNNYDIYENGFNVNNSFVITPQLYGAKGDGLADDATAIQQTINNSSVIFIPDGVYMLGSPINIKSDKIIILSKNAILRPFEDVTGYIVNMIGYNNTIISGGSIDGNILCQITSNFRIEKCNLKHINYQQTATDCVLDSCNIEDLYNCGTNIKCYNSKITKLNAQGGSEADIYNCVFESDNSNLFYVGNDITEATGKYKFSNCVFNGNDTTPIINHLNRSLIDVVEFIGCKFYNIKQPFVIGEKTSIFKDCDFHTTVSNLWALFMIHGGETLKLFIDGCSLYYDIENSILKYVVTNDGAGKPFIIFKNNHFSDFWYLLLSENEEESGRIIAHDNFCLNTTAYRTTGSMASVNGGTKYTINEHNNICE